MDREFFFRKKEYVPAQLRVIVIAPQRIICDSGSPSEGTPGSTELTPGPTELTPGGLI